MKVRFASWFGVSLAVFGLACTKPSSPTSDDAKSPVEAPPPTSEPAQGELTCGVAKPRAAVSAYARACAYLDERTQASAPTSTPPEGIPPDWQPVRSEAGTIFVPPDWIVIRDGASLSAVAPGSPEQASGLSCTLTKELPNFQTELDSALKLAREELDGMADGKIEVAKQTIRGVDTARLSYAIFEDQRLERLYTTAEGVREVSCIDGSRRGFEGLREEVEQVLDSLLVGVDHAGVPYEPPCPTPDGFVAFPGPVDFVNADLVPLVNVPGARESVALAEIRFYTQCTYWATLLPLDGGPRTDAVIVGYEPLAERDAEFAPARLSLETRGGSLFEREPEADRPATLATDVVMIEPADDDATLLPMTPPAGLELDASSELVAVVSLSGADGPPVLAFVREQSCLVQYRSFEPSTWKRHADSCKPPEPPERVEPELPHPPPKGKMPKRP